MKATLTNNSTAWQDMRVLKRILCAVFEPLVLPVSNFTIRDEWVCTAELLFLERKHFLFYGAPQRSPDSDSFCEEMIRESIQDDVILTPFQFNIPEIISGKPDTLENFMTEKLRVLVTCEVKKEIVTID